MVTLPDTPEVTASGQIERGTVQVPLGKTQDSKDIAWDQQSQFNPCGKNSLPLREVPSMLIVTKTFQSLS